MIKQIITITSFGVLLGKVIWMVGVGKGRNDLYSLRGGFLCWWLEFIFVEAERKEGALKSRRVWEGVYCSWGELIGNIGCGGAARYLSVEFYHTEKKYSRSHFPKTMERRSRGPLVLTAYPGMVRVLQPLAQLFCHEHPVPRMLAIHNGQTQGMCIILENPQKVTGFKHCPVPDRLQRCG